MEKQPQGGIRRVTTTNDKAGLAIVEHDDECELLDVTPEHATFAVSDGTDSGRSACSL